MKNVVNQLIPHLARYESPQNGKMELTAEAWTEAFTKDHKDPDTSFSHVIDVIKPLSKGSQPSVASTAEKVKLWQYNSSLEFKPGENVDMDLLSENRLLIHTGKFLYQPDTFIKWNSWCEVFVLLFDNYLVITEPKEMDGVTKYHVKGRPIPLDLLTLENFTDPPKRRRTCFLRCFGCTPDNTDSRVVYPCTISHNGRLGRLYTVYAESSQARAEWEGKLQEAIGLHKVVQESNKVFEVQTLNWDTFFDTSTLAAPTNNSWNTESTFTGKVTCSVPFSTADGRSLVAVGCAEGVWMGSRHDSRTMHQVLDLKMVTQCAILNDFGIFLVLADKSLFAFDIGALAPSSPQCPRSPCTSKTPQKLNDSKNVQYFGVGRIAGRTLVIYMKKKGLDSVFRVLEPVHNGPSGLFRVYRDFFLPSVSYNLVFLKTKIAIFCSKGFEILDISDFKSVTLPQSNDPCHKKLVRRCRSCRPISMFRSSENEFLLCYDKFGLYVNRHGEPSRTQGTIEWEGTAEHVAWHPPYILIFDSRFIEVRHVETGRLCQVIPGRELRCTWAGRGVTLGPNGAWEGSPSQEARVHGVMYVDDTSQVHPGSSGAAHGVVQHIFELIPTVPLSLSEKLSSPMQQSSFMHPSSKGSP